MFLKDLRNMKKNIARVRNCPDITILNTCFFPWSYSWSWSSSGDQSWGRSWGGLCVGRAAVPDSYLPVPDGYPPVPDGYPPVPDGYPPVPDGYAYKG